MEQGFTVFTQVAFDLEFNMSTTVVIFYQNRTCRLLFKSVKLSLWLKIDLNNISKLLAIKCIHKLLDFSEQLSSVTSF